MPPACSSVYRFIIEDTKKLAYYEMLENEKFISVFCVHIHSVWQQIFQHTFLNSDFRWIR